MGVEVDKQATVGGEEEDGEKEDVPPLCRRPWSESGFFQRPQHPLPPKKINVPPQQRWKACPYVRVFLEIKYYHWGAKLLICHRDPYPHMQESFASVQVWLLHASDCTQSITGGQQSIPDLHVWRHQPLHNTWKEGHHPPEGLGTCMTTTVEWPMNPLTISMCPSAPLYTLLWSLSLYYYLLKWQAQDTHVSGSQKATCHALMKPTFVHF